MYQPPHFREDRPEMLHQLVRTHPLGLFIVNGPEGPIANPVPFRLHVDATTGDAVLKAHLARANPVWKFVRETPETPVLVVFQGPQAYVTPSWYASKVEHGKVVPTWNYVVVQARGMAKITEERDALMAHLGQLTNDHEAARAEPWAMEDAPADFIERQVNGIVGLTINVTSLEGKWKVSQNRDANDRAGVVAGYRSQGNDVMAALVPSEAPES